MRRYTWVPDLPDVRDHLMPTRPGRLPKLVDRRAQCSEIEDQGPLGSCTGNGIVGAMEFLLLKEGRPFVDLSRLFVYYLEREAEHTVGRDDGAQIRTGIKQVHKVGVCSEKTWPYDVSRFKHRPSEDAYSEALDHRTTEYLRCASLRTVQRSLADGFPVVFGFTCYTSIDEPSVARTGFIPMPKGRERAVGGHCVMAVGYDDEAGHLIIRNSWGKSWGREGYGFLPYGYVENRGLSDDYWSIRR